MYVKTFVVHLYLSVQEQSAKEDTVDLPDTRLAARKLHWPDSKLTSVIRLILWLTVKQICMHAHLQRRQRLLRRDCSEMLADTWRHLNDEIEISSFVSSYQVSSLRFPVWTNRVHLAICPSIELECWSLWGVVSWHTGIRSAHRYLEHFLQAKNICTICTVLFSSAKIDF